jgi:hypothetical protein
MNSTKDEDIESQFVEEKTVAFLFSDIHALGPPTKMSQIPLKEKKKGCNGRRFDNGRS